MAEIRTVTTLRRKRREIEKTIALYENKLGQARADLSALAAAIAIFELSGEPKDIAGYADLHRLFKRGEMTKICMGALRVEGPQTTPQLAEHVMRAKGLDTRDKVMRKAICYRIVQALRLHHRTGKLRDAGRAKGNVRVWALP